jgi:hypothetical protein
MATIELFTLANHAEAINGLLYMSGAGWTNVRRDYAEGGGPTPHHFGIGVSVLVPWTEANQRHRLAIWVESEDGGEALLRAEGELEVGRPAGAPHGADQRAVLALESVILFPGPGGYRAVAEVDGDRRTYAFSVVDNVAQARAS